MALGACLRLTGTKQGVIKGPVTTKGRENSIEVHSYTHVIEMPRDAASGLPSGKRQHQLFVIVKDVDQTSPLLFQAFVTNEVLSSWVLQLWETAADETGSETQFFTINLTNATIAEIDSSMADNEDPVNSGRGREEISFVYQKIEWAWTDGGVSAQDDWTETKA